MLALAIDQCNGLYVAAVMYGSHTNNEYWMYMEGPINTNDEGPLALWTASKPEGPFTFKAYVLDGGLDNKGGWDAGRYSESRVEYFDGLFHLFATASAVGGASPNKVSWGGGEGGGGWVKRRQSPMRWWSLPLGAREWLSVDVCTY